jgi:hypothetical protein
MERQRQEAAASTRRESLFVDVLGGGRGLGAKASYARDLAGLDVDEVLEGEMEELAEVFYRLRSAGGPLVERMREELAERVSEKLWSAWWARGVDTALMAMGLGTRNRSPWLLSQKSASSGGRPDTASKGYKRTIHIVDMRVDAPWVGDWAADQSHKEVRSLCGLDEGDLDTPRNYSRSQGVTVVSEHYPSRGIWRAPSAHNAWCCPKCESLASGLIIPALTEGANASLARDWTDSGEQKAALEMRALILLDTDRSYSEVVDAINSELRVLVLQRLGEIARADPLPVIMGVLAVPERRALAVFSQSDCHRQLAAFDWESILDQTMSLGNKADADVLRRLLRAAVQDLTECTKSV